MNRFEAAPEDGSSTVPFSNVEETLNEQEHAVEKLSVHEMRPGDQFVDTADRTYEVRRIVSVPGDTEKGSVLLRWYKEPSKVRDFDVSYKMFDEQSFLGKDVTIKQYDRPRLPDGVDLKQFKEYTRWEAATKQIDEMLNERNLEISERDRLNCAKANIVREILAAIKNRQK